MSCGQGKAGQSHTSISHLWLASFQRVPPPFRSQPQARTCASFSQHCRGLMFLHARIVPQISPLEADFHPLRKDTTSLPTLPPPYLIGFLLVSFILVISALSTSSSTITLTLQSRGRFFQVFFFNQVWCHRPAWTSRKWVVQVVFSCTSNSRPTWATEDSVSEK